MKKSTQKLVASALIAAVYAVLTIVLAPICYGPLQFRVSEVLCILPFFAPFSTWGLFVGCIVANLVSAYGPLDIIFGSLATLGAALSMAAIGRKSQKTASKALAAFMPVLFNGVIVGAVIAWSETQALDAFWPAFFLNAGSVALGEAGVLYIIGLPLMLRLPRTTFFRDVLRRFQ